MQPSILKSTGISIINNNPHYHNELNYCFPDYIFVNKEEISEFTCPINFGILNDPVTDTCGHAFCRKCILEWVRSDSKCPFSRKPLTINELYPTLMIKNILSKQNVKCVNSDCQWVGHLENLFVHLEKECDYTKVKCKYSKCTKETDRKDIASHERKCEMKVVICEFCLKSFELSNFYKHKEMCHANTLKCDQCHEMVSKCFFHDHIRKECPESVVNCCLNEYGCPIKMLKKEMDPHIIQNISSHFSILENKLKKDINFLTEENKKLKSENSLKFQEIWEFTKQMKTTYENENHGLKNEINNLKSKVEKFKLENDDLRDSFIFMREEKRDEIRNLKLIIEDFFKKNAENNSNSPSYQSQKMFLKPERPNTQRLYNILDEGNSSFDGQRSAKKANLNNNSMNDHRDLTPPKEILTTKVYLKDTTGNNNNNNNHSNLLSSLNNSKVLALKDMFGQKFKDMPIPPILDFEKCRPKKILPLLCHTDFIEDICTLGVNNKHLSFATCSNDKLIKIWGITNNSTCNLIKTIDEHSGSVNRILYIQKKRVLISGGSDGIVKFWKAETWMCLKTLQAHTESILGLAYIQGSNYIATSSVDKTIIIWEMENYHLKLNFDLNEVITEIYYVGLPPNTDPSIKGNSAEKKKNYESYILAGDAKGIIYLNEFDDKSPFLKLKKSFSFKAHEDAIYRLLLVETNNTIVSTSFEDDKIKIWNAYNMELVKTFQIFDKGIISVSFDPLNEVLITAGQRDNHCLIKIIKLDKYAVIRAFKEEYSSKNVMWMPEKNILISSGGTIGFQGKMNIIFF